MEQYLLLSLLFLPLIGAGLILLIGARVRFFREALSLIVVLANLVAAIALFGQTFSCNFGGIGFGIEFSFRLYHFNSFIVSAVAVFSFLIILYSISFFYKNKFSGLFFVYFLASLSFINAALLADNLVVLLFFWEGILLALFGMIALGGKNSYSTAIKALIILGITDLCMMVGVALTGHLSGTLELSKINLNPSAPLAGLAFVLLIIGAISKAGAIPFHTWIPDAAIDAPLPFMALFTGALEKLIGIYFLARITLDMFRLEAESSLSILLMVIGVVTIILAVMMALVQKDYKKLLSYHAISQVGYMILGIGTCLPVGIVGGLFHMLNNAMYKSCLFLTAGSVEKQTGTTNLEKLGGLRTQMPVTFFCFVVAALSISGVPPFNGFFSKELIYDAALERGAIFYFCAVLGSFFTAASFLKLGAAAFFGKANPENKDVKEAPWPMLVPAIAIALGCIFFGLRNSLPVHNLILPVSSGNLEVNNFAGAAVNVKLVLITVVVLVAALINHILGAKIKGSNLKAVDYIHEAPGLRQIYSLAERGFFDPYQIGLKLAGSFAKIAFSCDRLIDWLTSDFFTMASLKITAQIRKAHTGNYAAYLSWSLLGMFLVIIYLVYKQ